MSKTAQRKRTQRCQAAADMRRNTPFKSCKSKHHHGLDWLPSGYVRGFKGWPRHQRKVKIEKVGFNDYVKSRMRKIASAFRAKHEG